MLSFKQFILIEGGNIKANGHAAEPLEVPLGKRAAVQKDVHGVAKAVADSFKKSHGEGHDLFGKNHKALETGTAYAGSTNHLMDKKISDHDFHHGMTKPGHAHPKPGDIDLKVPEEHLDKLHAHLEKHTGKKFGAYTLLGVKKGAGQRHAIMQHNKTKAKHQIDFEGSHYEDDEPSKGDQFSHSSNWEDRKAGIKGAHHKILMNAAGGDKHVFSPQYGLGQRANKLPPSKQKDRTKDPKEVSKRLFGAKADHKKIHSFQGVTELIKKHIKPEHHQKIYNKFKERTSSSDVKDAFSHEHALNHLRKHLDVHDE